MDQLNDDAAEPPHINGRGVFEVLDVVEHFNAMGFTVLIENVVQEFRAHVLWSCEFVLLEIFENEAGAIVDKFELIGLLFLSFKEDVFCLDI